MSWICYVGDRAVRPDAVLPARRRDPRARASSRSSRWSRSTPATRSESVHPSLSWLNPFDIGSFGALTSAMLLGDLHLLGLGHGRLGERGDRGLDAHAGARGGRQHRAPAGDLPDRLDRGAGVPRRRVPERNQDDVLSALGKGVLGSPLDKVLIIAVLTSASASTQTTILPATRQALSMAAHGAFPKYFARINSKHLTPGVGDDLDVRDLDRLLRHPELGLGQHPRGLGHGDRSRDRLLLRSHRPGVRLVLPSRAGEEPAQPDHGRVAPARRRG